MFFSRRFPCLLAEVDDNRYSDASESFETAASWLRAAIQGAGYVPKIRKAAESLACLRPRNAG